MTKIEVKIQLSKLQIYFLEQLKTDKAAKMQVTQTFEELNKLVRQFEG